ncbi:DEAD box helicase, partial [Peziza echinospora]
MPEPISPWRLRPDIPSVEELLRTDVHIPPNIIDKKWKSVEEYLGSHYELLREDACSTLRDVALTMKVTPSMSDQAALCIYENVRVKGYTFSQLGVGVKISFSLNRARKKILWSQSKRLIPGTLVCLSSDNFQDGKNMKLATVLARPISALELTPPEVDILFLENEIEVDATKQWLMVESRGSYFEAYKHTLRALQRMKDSNFPLNNHIVSLENDIPAPEYLQNDPWFDLSKLSKNTEDDPKFKRCNILEEWPPVDKDDMDANQLNALKRMITKRLAIVQGPPGTGKTYTSVLALKILLSNMKEGDPPIIISCQTNHALDQLLNKIIPFETNIIRLGGRTQDKDEIKKRTLYEKRQTTNIKVKGNSRTRAKAEMLRLQERMATVLEPLTTNIISPAALCALGIITVAQRDAFLNRRSDWVSVQDDSNPEGDMSSWLEGYIIQVEVEHNSYDELEDEDIDAEQLHTMQAEFLGTDVEEREFVLRGQYLELKKSHYVAEPYAVDKRELNEYVKKNNVWDWPQHIRAAAYKRWSALAVQKIAAEVRAINTRYGAVVKDFKIASLERDAYILEGAKVVGMTNTGLAKYRSLIGSIRPRVVMIEEAAESLEGPIITACFPTVEHLILVGDHQQLRPQCNSRELGIAPFNLGISMFERLVNNQIGFDRLKVQFRMRPEIRCLLSPIYDDLTDHKSVLEKPPVEGMGGTNVFFYWHTKLEARDEGTSRLNEHEAEMVVNFTRYLVFNGILPQKITILTFYGGQKNFISRLIRKDAELRPFRHNIQVATVDSYQGEENDIILLSLVRSNTEQVVGFLDVRNRVCVAMSRAQRGFYIFGNGRMLTNANELWWEISQILNSAEPKMLGYNLPLTCQKHKRQIAITELTQWLENKGGCNERCREVRHCGHICTSKCHAFSHENLVCYEKCEKILPCCGLQCPKDCHEECAC